MGIQEINQHIMFIDDLYGSCGNCKKLGLTFVKDKICPECKTKFKYLATNLEKMEDIQKILNRIDKENLELQLIEKKDFLLSKNKETIQDLFKK